MADRADAIVVGGGIFGCSIASHLLRAGVRDVLLLERDDVAQATSNAGAGFVALWGGGHVPVWGPDELALERYAIDFYRDLADTSAIEFKQNGTVWAATSETAWEMRVAPIAASPLMDTQVLDGPELASFTGITTPDGVHRAVFQPDGCQVSAGAASRALADRVRGEGGRIEGRRPVTGLRTASGRVTGVETPWGPVESPVVVLAAGAWTNQLLAGVGQWLPMAPMMASRLTTGPLGIQANMPSMIWPEFAGMWVRESSGGLIWGCGYFGEPRFAFLEALPPDRFDQVCFDGVEQMRAVGREASSAIPILAQEMSVTVAHGAPCYTADVVGLVGPIPAFDGLWVSAGCNEAGVTHGPGYGKVLADLITDGTTDLTNAERLRVDRFDGQFSGPAEFAAHTRAAIAAYLAGQQAAKVGGS